MQNIDSDLYWLGGSPCSGKSTVAELLAAQYNLQYYNCDHAFAHHQQQSDPTQQPTLHHLSFLTSDEIWLAPIAEQVARVIAIYHEEFPLILADLAAFSTDCPVLVEGAALMPTLVAGTVGWQGRSAWLVPTPTFQRQQYAKRPWVNDVLNDCRDPKQAFANWMARDDAFAVQVAQAAAQRNCPLLHVDGYQSIAETATWVSAQWGLG